MINYKYLEESDVLEALINRPKDQHVVITGRAASQGLIDVSDTVSEVEDIKHAFRANIRAQKGIDLQLTSYFQVNTESLDIGTLLR